MVWHQVHVWLGKPILVDTTLVGSQAHWIQWMWTNITPLNLLQWAYDLVPWPKGLTMDAILDSKRMSHVVQLDDCTPLAIVNKVGWP
jgi:hypothetical protein